MKTLALLAILALHSFGLWPHIAPSTRTQLSQLGSGLASAETGAASAGSAQPPAALPIRTTTTSPSLNAAAVIAIDRDTSTVLYAKSSEARRPIASLTKLITALVILSRHTPDERLTIPTLPDYPQAAETMGLVPGDTFALGDVLEAALVPSANDAADALAIADAGSLPKFAARMNLKMAEWGIADARFVSASGLQDDGNYASAAALAKVAGLALHNPTIAAIVQRSSISIMSDQGRTYNLKSTNDLLASGRFYGIKTGYTFAAGECFVGLTRINGHEVITVVLGSDNRFGTTTTLTNWIGRSWQWL